MAITLLQILATLGILLSIYITYVEYRKSKSKTYKAVCDISKKISCTEIVSSKYAKTLGIPNSIAGLIFYVIVAILAMYNYISYIIYLSILGLIVTIYLSHIMIFKLKKTCIVCLSLYIINILILAIVV